MKTELKTGWLSPDGTLYQCDVYSHIDKAYELLPHSKTSMPDAELHDAGWCEITLGQMGQKRWKFYWTKFLTEQQRNFLRPYFNDVFPVDDLVKYNFETEEGLR